MLAEAGVDINTIMKRVGHDDMKTTMGIYTQVTDKMKKTATEKIMNTFGDILTYIFFIYVQSPSVYKTNALAQALVFVLI